MKITILLLMIAALLSNWGYNTTTLVAGLGVGGIAIALAAQKTIENFFGGVAVVSDRPVAVGDFCKFGDRQGTVEDIGLRSTRIRTLGPHAGHRSQWPVFFHDARELRPAR